MKKELCSKIKLMTKTFEVEGVDCLFSYDEDTKNFEVSYKENKYNLTKIIGYERSSINIESFGFEISLKEGQFTPFADKKYLNALLELGVVKYVGKIIGWEDDIDILGETNEVYEEIYEITEKAKDYLFWHNSYLDYKKRSEEEDKKRKEYKRWKESHPWMFLDKTKKEKRN